MGETARAKSPDNTPLPPQARAVDFGACEG